MSYSSNEDQTCVETHKRSLIYHGYGVSIILIPCC